VYPLEFTSRFGFPTISIQMEGMISPWGELLHALASGQDYNLKTKKGFQVCVVIATPPFPFYDKVAFNKYSKEAVIIFKKDKMDGIHLGDVKFVDGDIVLAGVTGYALVITGSGSTMEAARKQAYNRVANITLPNMFYRTDIGLRWSRDSDKLHTWGYLY
jgi:phosphoribosylamine---glycine ligase